MDAVSPALVNQQAGEFAAIKKPLRECSAYILCGGRSSRMGEEKGLVEFQGQTFVHRILDALFPLVAKPALVTKNSAYEAFKLEMIQDLIEDKGPVGGIYTALTHSTADLVLVLSCDIPKITTNVLSWLISESSIYPNKITFLSDGKNDYPLIGVYPKSCLPFFESSISKDELKLRLLVESLPHQRIMIDPKSIHSLQNINTKKELVSLSQTY